MKVLICHRPDGAFGYISDGWHNALHDKQHTVRRWDGREETWREFGPDIYIGCSGHKQPIPSARNECKVVLHVNPHGPVYIDGINESPENISWVVDQKPDLVIGYGHDNDAIIWSGWTSDYGIKWVPMPCAADRILFGQVNKLEDRDLDLVYLGGRWKYKARTIDAYLLPVLKDAKLQKRSLSVRGWGEWPDGLCDGILASDQANAFINRGKVGPCISELHSHQFGIDIPERAFKLALCGTLVIHDAVMHVKQMIPSAIVAANPKHFYDMCMHYMNNNDERIELALKQQSEVIAGHTYHHRMARMFEALGYEKQAAEMLE